MKKNKKHKLVRKECISCKNNLFAWLSSMNYDNDKEEAIKKNIYNYCPICIVAEEVKHKGRM